MTLPNFLIIGAMRSGTTSLWHYLNKHPQVFMSQVKEPMFFCDREEQGRRMDGLTWWTKTLEDYQQLFEGSSRHRAVGEASPHYLHDSRAVQRIKDLIPEARLICSLRDPCERAYSEYVFRCMRGVETRASFLDAIRADQDLPERQRFLYLEQGLYHRHLSKFLETFPRDRIKIVLYQDIRSDSTNVVRGIFDFLGVDPEVPVDTEARLQTSGVPKNKPLAWLLDNRRKGLRKAIMPVVPDRLHNLARNFKNKNLERQSLSEHDRAEIQPFFAEDTAALERLLGRELPSWRACERVNSHQVL